MKKISVLFAILLFINFRSLAQAPQGINYQGVARNSAGAAMGLANINVRFTILQSGTTVYQETHAALTDTFGLYNKVIGQGTVVTGNFSSINWGAGNLSIQIDIDDNSGSGFQTVGISQLNSVPYAMYANSAGNSSNGTVTSLTGGSGIDATPSTITTTGSFSLAPSGVAAGTYGNASTYPVITVDAMGRVTSANTQTVAAGISSIAGAAPVSVTGGLTPTVSISAANSSTDGFLSQTDWATFNNKVSSVSNGIGILSNVLGTTYTLSADNTNAIWNANALQGTTISTAVPTINQVMQFNGTSWTPATMPGALPTPTVGSLLFADLTNTWTGTNPTQVSSDGNSITVTNNTSTGTAGTFIDNSGNSGNPALLAQSNSSTGYAIRALNSAGAAISASSGGPYVIGGDLSSGGGSAVVGRVMNGANGTSIWGVTDNFSTGSAGLFENNNTTNTAPTLDVTNTGTGFSGRFAGGSGVQIDKLQVQNGLNIPLNSNLGWVLTSDVFGNATWQPPAGSLPGGSLGQVMFNNGTSWTGSNPSTLYYDGNQVGIGTSTPGALLDIGPSSNALTMRVTNTSANGVAAYVNTTNVSNSSAALQVQQSGVGLSGYFTGGAGVQTDKLTVTSGLSFPVSATAGYVLTSNATGDASWQPVPGGVTAISGANPVVISGTTSNPIVSLPKANGATSGYLDFNDWTAFNSKVSSVGTATTLVNTGTATSPTLGLALSGVTPGTYGNPTAFPVVTVDNYGRITAVSTQPVSSGGVTSVNTATTDIVGGPITSTGTLSLANTGVTPGSYGSATSIPTFTVDAKGRITNITTTAVSTTGGTLSGGTANYIPKWLTPTTLAGTSLLYDATTGVGVNTTSPAALLDVISTVTNTAGPALKASQAGTTNSAAVFTVTASTNTLSAVSAGTSGNGPAGVFTINNAGSTAAALMASSSGTGPAIFSNGPLKLGNVIIDGTSSPGTNGDVLTSQGGGLAPKWVGPAGIVAAGGGWTTSGNSISVGQFIGTNNAQDFVLQTTVGNNIVFKTNSTERMRLDASGSLGLGTNAPLAKFHLADDANSRLFVQGSSSSPTSILIMKSNGTVAAPSAPIGGMAIGDIGFSGYNGSSFVSTMAAGMRATASQVYSATGMGTDLLLATTANGSTSPVDRMTISNSGNVGVGAYPAQMFDVMNKFQVNSAGNIVQLNGVTTNFPPAQGGPGTVLTNDGTGNLNWQPSVNFSAQGSGQSFSTSVATAVTFTNTAYTNNATFNGTTFTANLAGVYHFDAAVSVNIVTALGSPQDYVVRLVCSNGVTRETSIHMPTGYTGVTQNQVGADFNMLSGQTVQVMVFQSTGQNLSTASVAAQTYFNCHLVR